jgi:hypothetical protein
MTYVKYSKDIESAETEVITEHTMFESLDVQNK